MAEPASGLTRRPAQWLARRSTAQLAAAMGVLSALALAGSLLVTDAAVRMDQREKAALAALDDYGAMVSKLGAVSTLTADRITEADAAYLSAWLSAFQSGPTRENSQPPEEYLLALIEQPVAPFDGAPEGSLPLGHVLRSAGEQLEAVAQAG